MTREEAIETLKENYCAMCAYGSQNMMSCDIRGCDNRDAIKALELEPCDDAISKQAVLDTTICDGISCNECSFNTCEDGQAGCLLKERVEKLPPVTPQPKIGHWIEITQYSDAKHKIECSECGNHIIDRGHANSFNVKNKYKYCPNCGCRMESESEEWKKNFQMQ